MRGVHCYIVILLVALAPFPAAVFAQGSLPVEQNPLQLELSPRLPGPEETVEATLSGFGFDLDRADVRWFIDGRLELRGPGERRLQFETDALGSRTVLEVIARSQSGREVSVSRTIRPASVDLVWEGETYTPPFYSGRALHSPGSLVSITAVPQFVTAAGTALEPDELIYKWTRDGSALGERSGSGKRRITLENPGRLEPLSVRVEVSSPGGSLHGEGAIVVPVSDPRVHIYEAHPLEGVRFQRALSGAFTPREEEVTVRAYPYFFSAEEVSGGDLRYRWQVGGREARAGSEPSALTLRRTGEEASESAIAVSLQHLSALLQSAQAAFRVVFEAK